jgi:hypothetical protein
MCGFKCIAGNKTATVEVGWLFSELEDWRALGILRNEQTIHILIPDENQEPVYNQYNNIFQIAKAINELHHKYDEINTKGPIKVTNSQIGNLEGSLLRNPLNKTRVIMWGDHSNTMNIIGETSETKIVAQLMSSGGSGSIYPYEFQDINFKKYWGMAKGSPPIKIDYNNEIILMNFGCNSKNDTGYKDMLNVNGKYIGKYPWDTYPNIVILDIMIELLAIGSTFIYYNKGLTGNANDLVNKNQIENFITVFDREWNNFHESPGFKGHLHGACKEAKDYFEEKTDIFKKMFECAKNIIPRN